MLLLVQFQKTKGVHIVGEQHLAETPKIDEVVTGTHVVGVLQVIKRRWCGFLGPRKSHQQLFGTLLFA
jgi:hypothetical protein